MNAPYKYDIVGSFLRDKEIKQAREDFSLGKINQSQLEILLMKKKLLV